MYAVESNTINSLRNIIKHYFFKLLFITYIWHNETIRENKFCTRIYDYI